MELKELLNIAKRKPQKADRSFGVYYSSKFPTEIYKMRHPGLDAKEYEYIEENWVNPVQKLVGDAIFETQKIFTDGNYSIQTKNENIQKFIEEEGGGDFAGNLPGGNWKPVKTDDGDGAKLYIQKGSKMNDGEFDDDAPF